MAMKFLRKTFGNAAEFIIGDHCIILKELHARATSAAPGFATLVGDRYVVVAGTLIKDSGGAPLGLCYRDIDVTDGDDWLPIVVHAVVNRSALPAALSYAEEKALRLIHFVGGTAPEEIPADPPVYHIVDIATVEHATIAPEEGYGRIVADGGDFKFKETAGEGYHVTGVTANSETITADTGGVYTVEEINEDQAISATVAAD